MKKGGKDGKGKNRKGMNTRRTLREKCRKWEMNKSLSGVDKEIKSEVSIGDVY